MKCLFLQTDCFENEVCNYNNTWQCNKNCRKYVPISQVKRAIDILIKCNKEKRKV